MALLKREEIAQAKLRHIDVHVLGGEIRVWEMNARQRVSFYGGDKEMGLRALDLVRLCAGDEAGPFDPPIDVDALPGAVMQRLCDAAVELNVISQEAAEEQRGN